MSGPPSAQAAFLRNLIDATGTPAASPELLRSICREAVSEAPDGVVIRIAELLYAVRLEDAKKEAELN